MSLNNFLEIRLFLQAKLLVWVKPTVNTYLHMGWENEGKKFSSELVMVIIR